VTRISGRVFAIATMAALTSFASSASADGAPEDGQCAGTHSLRAPLPDSCLDVIDTDRPHQTDTPHVTPAGHTQIESAIVSAQLGGKLGAPPGERGAHVVLFEDNYKFGLVSNVDLQLLFKHAEYDVAAARLVPPGPFEMRVKINVVKERGAVPAITLVPWLFAPLTREQSWRGGPLVFWGWELPARFELEMNAGVLFGQSPKPAAAIVLASALTFTVASTFRVFADVYTTGWDAALGTGALWAFTRDMQIDLGTYVGLNGDEPKATPFLGFSIRW
jgi:hypothetical protein